MFDGFPFSDEYPYTDEEARRLLKLAMAEMRKDKSLQKLGIDPKPDKVVTGPWQCLVLKDAPKGKDHTAYPHLSLGVREEYLDVCLTIPNGAPKTVLRNISDIGTKGLQRVNAEILTRSARLRRRGGGVYAYALQRQWTSRRSDAIDDAYVEFDLETSQNSRGEKRVKTQVEWLDLFASLIRGKAPGTNIQFGYRVYLPWEMRGLNSRESLRMIAEGWWAMKPVLDVVRRKVKQP
jgi:hypothetical protein